MLRRLAILPPKVSAPRGKGGRTGKGLHELRDAFRTRYHKSLGDPLVAEFMMGHQVDPLGYNKAMDDIDYVKREYRKAEPWLNIISEDPTKVDVYEVETLRQHLEDETLARSGLAQQVEALQRIVELQLQHNQIMAEVENTVDAGRLDEVFPKVKEAESVRREQERVIEEVSEKASKGS